MIARRKENGMESHRQRGIEKPEVGRKNTGTKAELDKDRRETKRKRAKKKEED